MKYNTISPYTRLNHLIDFLEGLIKMENISSNVIKYYMNQIENCKDEIKEVNKHRILLRNINDKIKRNK